MAVPDPLVPVTSRFPLSASGGRVSSSSAAPSGTGTRPFGMRFAVEPVAGVQWARHGKKPTSKTRAEQTQITDDGQVVGHKSDTVHYVEMDEE